MNADDTREATVSTRANEKARPVVRVVTETWEPVAGPARCECGHLHFGRISHSSQAPQWHICEDPDCSCRTLRLLRLRLTQTPSGGDA